jgi:hypothetical protein
MEHPGKIVTRQEAIEYILRSWSPEVDPNGRANVRATLDEQTTEWLLQTANRALDIRVARAEKHHQSMAQRQRQDH